MAKEEHKGKVALAVIVFFVGILLPPEASLNLGNLRLSGYRVVLILFTVPALFMLFAGKRAKFCVFDGLVMAHAVWAIIALIKWGGFGQGIESGGIYFLECVGAYLLGRLFIRSQEDFAAFARFYVTIVVALLVFTLPEALTANHILRDTAAAALGGPGAVHIDQRMGLERAFGPFDHPILYGVFSAAAFSLAYYVVAETKAFSARGIIGCTGVITATFISASGGPYTALAAQFGVIGWERVTKGFNGRWLVLIGIVVLIYIGIDLLSNRSPIHVFVGYLSFSTQSSYNRINIFHFGSQEVARNPIFGLGLGDWIRPRYMSDSVDNFWLLITMRYGLPAFFFMVALVVGLVIAVARRKNLPPAWKRARHGWAFTLFGLSLVACTVHLWNALFVLFMFLIGSGVWMFDTKPEAQQQRTATGGDKPATPAGPPERLF